MKARVLKQEFCFKIQKVYSLLKMSVKKVYGCAANVKFRLGNIFKKPLYLAKKETKTLQLPGKFS